MNSRWILPFLLTLTLPINGYSSGSNKPFGFVDCQLPNSSINARCGVIDLAEDPNNPTSRTIAIKVAVAPSLSRDAKADPLFMFAGGPGQGAIESFPSIVARLQKLRQSRDIVLIDQRGTGGSNPLKCPLLEDLPGTDRQNAFAEKAIRRVTQDCLDNLDASPQLYTTDNAVKDFEAIRQKLGYEKINIFGVSYGTRVAQAYLRLFPESVRTAVLDSVVPNELILGTEHAIKLEQAVAKIIDRCAHDTSCNNHFPNLKEKLEQLKAAVRRTPSKLVIESPRTGLPTEILFNRETLGGVIRLLSYSTETQALIPLLIDEAVKTGNYTRLAKQAQMIQESLGESINRGLELSVMCAEDVPWYPKPGESYKSDSLLGDSLIRYNIVACSSWPKGNIPEDFHQPINNNIPTLLLSGELDPVTPPEYAEQVLSHLPNARHLIATGQGHSVLMRGCIPRLVTQFIELADPSPIDTTCLKNIHPAPFFTSLLGPNP